MPYVSVSTIRGILDAEQKKALLERITDVMVEIEGQGNPAFRASVWVKIDEQEPASWALGGQIPTTQFIASKFGPIGEGGVRKVAAKA